MDSYRPYVIKSFKHDGHLHRMWLENWLVPEHMLEEEHRAENMIVLVNRQTKIVEGGGKEWVSKIPAVSFFIPGQWYNVVGLIEEESVRYYCNIASPPYLTDDTLTYIDYDLDVVAGPGPDAEAVLLDAEEYEAHKIKYKYSDLVDQKVRAGLQALLDRVKRRRAPFRDEAIRRYYEMWEKSFSSGGGK